jgi:hypothetical protein
MPEWMRIFVEQVSAWQGVSVCDHRFGGVEFRLGTREIGHVHSFCIVDIPFTVKIRDALVRSGKAQLHHWLPDSGWTSIRVQEGEGENAIKSLRLSYLMIQLKSMDSFAASRALQELATGGFEDDVLGCFVDSIAASRTHIGGDH